MQTDGEVVPVLLVAGAPGAGKTSLLARWMAEPAFASAGALVNELGDEGIDAHLLRGTHSASRAVAGGCACCSARDALARSLEALGPRHRGAAAFDRIAVELAGVAYPRPLLEDFARGGPLGERFALHGLATVVDAGAGAAGLASPEARAQVAAADVLVLTKTDLCAPDALADLTADLVRANPHAELVAAGNGAREAVEVWQAAGCAPGRELRYLEAAFADPRSDGAPAGDLAAAHGDGLRVRTLRIGDPVELSAYCLRLGAFLEAHGDAVLRVKGLVAVRGRHGPAVIQAVRGVLHPVRTLREWPAGAAPGAIVVVARGLDEATISSALS